MPNTENLRAGERVPTPMLPLFRTAKSEVVALPVELAIEKRVVLVSPSFACMESFAYGEVVPMPMLPLVFQMPEPGKYALPEIVSAVVEAYGNVEAVEEVAVKYAPTISPTTESFAYGDVVPMPTLPFTIKLAKPFDPSDDNRSVFAERRESTVSLLVLIAVPKVRLPAVESLASKE